MTIVNLEMVRKLSRLAQIELSAQEEIKYIDDLYKLLDWLRILEEVDVEGVEALYSVNDLSATNVHYCGLKDLVGDDCIVAVIDDSSVGDQSNAYVSTSVDGLADAFRTSDGFYFVPSQQRV